MFPSARKARRGRGERSRERYNARAYVETCARREAKRPEAVHFVQKKVVFRLRREVRSTYLSWPKGARRRHRLAVDAPLVRVRRGKTSGKPDLRAMPTKIVSENQNFMLLWQSEAGSNQRSPQKRQSMERR